MHLPFFPNESNPENMQTLAKNNYYYNHCKPMFIVNEKHENVRRDPIIFIPSLHIDIREIGLTCMHVTYTYLGISNTNDLMYIHLNRFDYS